MNALHARSRTACIVFCALVVCAAAWIFFEAVWNLLDLEAARAALGR